MTMSTEPPSFLEGPKGTFVIYDYGVTIMAICVNAIVLHSVIKAKIRLTGYKYFLISLSVSNFYICCFNLAKFVIDSLRVENMEALLCWRQIFRGLQMSGLIANLLNLSGMSFDHLIGIVYPLSYSRVMKDCTMKIAVALLWAAALLVGSAELPLATVLYFTHPPLPEMSQPLASSMSNCATELPPAEMETVNGGNNSAAAINTASTMSGHAWLMAMSQQFGMDDDTFLAEIQKEFEEVDRQLRSSTTTPRPSNYSLMGSDAGDVLRLMLRTGGLLSNSLNETTNSTLNLTENLLTTLTTNTPLTSSLLLTTSTPSTTTTTNLLIDAVSTKMTTASANLSSSFFPDLNWTESISLNSSINSWANFWTMNLSNITADGNESSNINRSDPGYACFMKTFLDALNQVARKSTLSSDNESGWCAYYRNAVFLEYPVMALSMLAFIFVAICYLKVFREIFFKSEGTKRNVRKLVMTTFLLLFTFSLCYLPFMIFELSMAIGMKFNLGVKLQEDSSLSFFMTLHHILESILITSPLIQPLIYAGRLAIVRRQLFQDLKEAKAFCLSLPICVRRMLKSASLNDRRRSAGAASLRMSQSRFEYETGARNLCGRSSLSKQSGHTDGDKFLDS